jgi:hypothetical protein
MPQVTKKDLKVLLDLDEAGSDSWQLSNENVQNLLKAGLIDDAVNLTAEGVETIENVKAVLAKLKAGVPFAARKQNDPEAVYRDRPAAKWITGTVGGKAVVTDNALLYVGKPVAGMLAMKGSSEARKKFPKAVAKQKGNYVEVVPTYFQTEGTLDGFEAIWLGGENGTRVAMQTMYFDFIRDKFPSAKLFAAGNDKAIKARVKGKGVTDENVVAFVMPLNPKGWGALPGGTGNAKNKEVQK